MHLFHLAFYTSATYYALFVEPSLLLPFFVVVALYILISIILPKSKNVSTRKKLMIGTWTHPSQGVIMNKIPVRVQKVLNLINKLPKQNRPTLTHFAIKAVGQVLTTQPDLNGHLSFGKFFPYDTVDVSCLVDIEGGKDLAMICIKGVDKMSVQEIAGFIRTKTSKMKKSDGGQDHKKKTGIFKIMPAFIVGPLIQILSFASNHLGIQIKSLGLQRHNFGAACVTSIGTLGFTDATAPFSGFTNCSLLLSANAVHQAPVVQDGKIVVGQVMNCNFVVDHRYVDGGKCTKLCSAFKQVFENPQKFLKNNDK